MWNNNQRSLIVPEEEVVVNNDVFDNTNLFGLQHHHTSSAQVSLNFTNTNQRSSSLGRSQSLGTVNHQSSINQSSSSRVNETFGHPYFSQAAGRLNAPANNGNSPFERLIPSGGRNNNSNPFLGNPKVSSILAAATATSFATANSTAFSSTSPILQSLQKPPQHSRHSFSVKSFLSLLIIPY